MRQHCHVYRHAHPARNSLDVVQDDQIRLKYVSSACYVVEIVRRLTECDAVDDAFQCVQANIQPVAVLRSKLSGTDRLEINSTQTCELTIQQDRCLHLDIADDNPQ